MLHLIVTWGLGFVSCLGFLVFYFDILPYFMFLSCVPCPSCDHVMCYSCLCVMLGVFGLKRRCAE